MTQASKQAFITSQTIAVEHIRISSERSFAEVRRKLEAQYLSSIPALPRRCGAAIRNARGITKTTGHGCRSSVSVIMAPYCRLRTEDPTRCNTTSVIPLPPQR
jgi:hypothetical protein